MKKKLLIALALLTVYGVMSLVRTNIDQHKEIDDLILELHGCKDSRRHDMEYMEQLRNKIYDPVQMEEMSIRAKNSDKLYEALHNCVFNLNALISTVSKLEDENGQYGIMLSRMRRHQSDYQALLKATKPQQ